MRNFVLWLSPARLPFLVLTPACVLLGLASVHWTHDHLDLLMAALVMLGALAAHVSVNAFNEYLDFRSGLDAMTKPTPFSGGSGVLPLGIITISGKTMTSFCFLRSTTLMLLSLKPTMIVPFAQVRPRIGSS